MSNSSSRRMARQLQFSASDSISTSPIETEQEKHFSDNASVNSIAGADFHRRRCLEEADTHHVQTNRHALRNSSVNEHAGGSLGTSTSLILGMLPIVVNVLFRGSHQWLEICVVLMIAVWIYYILQTPWTLFHNSRHVAFDRNERFFIIMLFASPLLAAYSIQMARAYLGAESSIMANFSIPLFLCAAMLRPVLYFLQHCGHETHAPEHLPIENAETLEMLLKKIQDLEFTVAKLQTIGNVSVTNQQDQSTAAIIHLDKIQISRSSWEKLCRRIESLEHKYRQLLLSKDQPNEESSMHQIMRVFGIHQLISFAGIVCERIISVILLPFTISKHIIHKFTAPLLRLFRNGAV